MTKAILIPTFLLLFVVASVALIKAAPDASYWDRLFILLAAYFSGAAARSIST